MILNRQRAVRIARRPLEAFLRLVLRELGLADSEVTICLVNDREIARMNETFRRRRGPTDVLSFPEGPRPRGSATGRRISTAGREFTRRRPRTAEKPLGDIAIAPATARRYAKKNKRSLNKELRVLILHGVLHLLGYDHETDRGEMDRMERTMRRRFGLL
jgi:probable rRNA maturation factor